VAAVAALMTPRTFVDDECLGLPWQAQLARVNRGEAALQVMGDWARMVTGDGVVEWSVPGMADWFVAIVDFFVPLAHADAAASSEAAQVLTAARFQNALAATKGCVPAVRDAWGEFAPQRAGALGEDEKVLPSFSFDQCCSVARKQALLAVVAEGFIDRHDALLITRDLSALARRARSAA
jgi:hypothetical protein